MAAKSKGVDVGDKAPAFSLRNQDDEVVKLSGLKGRWVVLYFYPKDDTPGCTVEACDFSAGIKGFESLDADVYGCSPDSPERHRKFIAKHALKVSLLSDPEHESMSAYGSWGPKTLYGRLFDGVIRSTFIIDPEGRIAAVWPKVSVKGHAEAVRERLAELQSGEEPAAKKKPAAAKKKPLR